MFILQSYMFADLILLSNSTGSYPFLSSSHFYPENLLYEFQIPNFILM